MIDDLLTEIAERGWFVYSLRQSTVGWSCHLRDTLEGTSTRVLYGQGSSALGAVESATEAQAYEQEITPVTFTIGSPTPPSLLSMIPQTFGKVYRR